ncbi:MAG: GFA family protein [Pseudomonadota bacterium]
MIVRETWEGHMSGEITGGCKCGRVRYSGVPAQTEMFRCHCRDCQQLTGTGHADMVPLDAATFVIDDGCKVFAMQGGSGRLTFSGFCPHCGSQLTRRSERVAGNVYVHAGSLDDPSSYLPKKSIYIESAQPWDHDMVVRE